MKVFFAIALIALSSVIHGKNLSCGDEIKAMRERLQVFQADYQSTRAEVLNSLQQGSLCASKTKNQQLLAAIDYEVTTVLILEWDLFYFNDRCLTSETAPKAWTSTFLELELSLLILNDAYDELSYLLRERLRQDCHSIP